MPKLIKSKVRGRPKAADSRAAVLAWNDAANRATAMDRSDLLDKYAPPRKSNIVTLLTCAMNLNSALDRVEGEKEKNAQ